MVGIVAHVFTLDKSEMGMAIAGVMLLINLWMILDNRDKYKHLVS